ncbi:P-loop containing nucleoside triphosphate hydrolase protein [Lineolata rhizophorae]|uniref:P-loop containing nucleoside triphosphate hydrolase protein n=1 Tax=Lineolata rhizophorae TaxID=578093 RepID=A0A6A6P2C4_9PEZI|nr:P-loop containing nucleoside triphosphate hydrolase protein [Lineolata rhizophorae]
MSSTTSTPVPSLASSPSHQKIMSTYKFIFSGHEKNTSHSILTALRETYPDYHVTRTDFGSCDVIAYANAGHAEALLIDAINSEREYIPASPMSMLDFIDDPDSDYDSDDTAEKNSRHRDGDKLRDKVSFGLYAYKWNNMSFMVYTHKFAKRFEGPTKKLYVLAPRSMGMSSDGLYSVPTDQLLRVVGRWQATLHDEIYVFDDGMWAKSKELWRSVQGSSWADVILDPRTKDALVEDVHGFFTSRDLYEEFSVPWKRGVILHGLPGNGKTLSIKALMCTLYTSSMTAQDNEEDSFKHDDGEDNSSNGAKPRRHVPSLYVKSLQTCQGPQYAVRIIFSKARKMAPCMLIFEDLDSLVTEKVRSYFLNEVDGLESNNGILMVGSTNHLGALDPAIANRPSRFDRKYHFALPQKAERVAYAKYWRAKLERNGKVDFPEKVCDVVASWTSGFSFAYLKELFITALLTVARGGPCPGEEEDKEQPDGEGSDSSEKNFIVVGESGKITPIPEKVAVEDKSSEKDQKTVEDAAKQPGAKKESVVKMPEMVIPDELDDNVLLKVLRHQVRALLREMDNSKTASKGKKKKGEDYEDDEDNAEVQMMRQLLIRQAQAEAEACNDC